MTMINNKPRETYMKEVEAHAASLITTLETQSVFISPEDTSEEFDAAFALMEMGVAKVHVRDKENVGTNVGIWLTRADKSHKRPWAKRAGTKCQEKAG